MHDEVENFVIHPISIGDGEYFVYDTSTNYFLSISKSLYTKIKESGLVSCKCDDEFLRLRKAGFLKPISIKQIRHVDAQYYKTRLSRQLNNLILQITQDCNFRCRYCVYETEYETRNRSKQAMTWDVVQQSLQFFLRRTLDSNSLSVAFYGGEPLLEFEKIQRAVHYVKVHYPSKQIRFLITTNGSLLTERIVDFLVHHEFLLTISLDGNREDHDANRLLSDGKTGSFSLVWRNACEIRRRYPDYFKTIRFSCVLDPSRDFISAKRFFEDEIFRENPVTCSFINELYRKKRIVPSKAFLSEYLSSRQDAIRSLSASGLEGQSSNILASEIKSFFMKMDGRDHGDIPSVYQHSGICLPGVHKMFVDVHGDIFPCERSNEKVDALRIGNIHDGFDVEKAEHLLNLGSIQGHRCKRCWGMRFCKVCPALFDWGNVQGMAENCDRMLASVEEDLIEYLQYKCLMERRTGR